MLIRPLSIENLELRQLLSGVSNDTAPSSTVAAAQPPLAVAASVTDEASSQPGINAPSTDADADSYASSGSASSGSASTGSASTGSASIGSASTGVSSSAAAGSATSNAVDSSTGGSSSSGTSTDITSTDSTPGDSPSEYQSSNMTGMAEYANQRQVYGSSDNYGSYSSYAYQQQINQAAGAAQLLANQTNAARRAPSEQLNPLLAHPADVSALQAVAAPIAPQASGRALYVEPGQGVESHTTTEQPRTEPANGEVRFAAGLPIEWRASPDALGHGEGATEATAAFVSNSSPRVEPLLAGILPVDLPALEAGVERFFARLEELGDELCDPDVAWRLVAWSLTAAGAAAALEFARAEAKDSRPREPLLGGLRLPPPPRPKEWPA